MTAPRWRPAGGVGRGAAAIGHNVRMKSSSAPFVLTAGVTTAALVGLAVVSRIPTYRFAPAFLIPLLWLGYALRRRLHLHPLHYLLFASALVLHNLGAFGMYQRSVLGVSFDVYVHTYFGFVGTLVLRRSLDRGLRLRPWQCAAGAVLLAMGMGAVHEIVEYASYLMLGEERGMLKPSTSYKFDTQRDLVCNLAGALTAVVAASVTRLVRGRGSP